MVALAQPTPVKEESKDVVKAVSEFSSKLRKMSRDLALFADQADELGLLILKDQEETEAKLANLNSLRQLLQNF